MDAHGFSSSSFLGELQAFWEVASPKPAAEFKEDPYGPISPMVSTALMWLQCVPNSIQRS